MGTMPAHVLLLFGQRYNPAIHRGVALHAGRARWHLSMLIHQDGRALMGLSKVQGVVLADRFGEAVIDSILATGLPVVNLSSNPEVFPGAWVTADNRAIGGMAAEYLLARQYRNFAYFGEQASVASRERHEAFRAALRRHGADCRLIESAPRRAAAALDWDADLRRLQRRLADLPAPSAVFCFNDAHAGRFLDAALQMGRRVPEEVAILGVDDDPLLCETMAVPLSSVRHPLEEAGTRGAEVLDAVMAGRAKRSTTILLAPKGVSTRRSTDHFAVSHPTLQAVLLHLDRHHHRALSLGDVAKAAGVSPRTVQLLLQTELRSSVTEELQKRRMAHARRLLAAPSPAIADVAALAGFASASYFHHAFKRATGQTPRDYRQACLRKG